MPLGAFRGVQTLGRLPRDAEALSWVSSTLPSGYPEGRRKRGQALQTDGTSRRTAVAIPHGKIRKDMKRYGAGAIIRCKRDDNDNLTGVKGLPNAS
jgi:hypothetical protein